MEIEQGKNLRCATQSFKTHRSGLNGYFKIIKSGEKTSERTLPLNNDNLIDQTTRSPDISTILHVFLSNRSFSCDMATPLFFNRHRGQLLLFGAENKPSQAVLQFNTMFHLVTPIFFFTGYNTVFICRVQHIFAFAGCNNNLTVHKFARVPILLFKKTL